ncbi:hypothetical protein [Nocardia aurantiaca]|uniref:Lipoprotein n=1 Tax=Nocardia aurantiaca TaxID=2675850 RepID=A0A6I3KWF6_9NOCA|nr:hypothetical protein [Nocardia aurantiaca]MTE12384.1 hypothetical protein [Nocardia aurantiaca]
MVGRWRIGGAILALIAVGLCACTGAPDRRGQAARLQTEIATMPGVQSFSANVTNDFEHGANLGLEADMRTATEDQIAAVAARIKQLEGDDFDEYRQHAVFTVADKTEVKRDADFDPNQIADDARRLRQVTSAVPTDTEKISWFHSKSASIMDFGESRYPQDILAAVRGAIDDQPVQVTIFGRSNSELLIWTVNFPFTADEQTAVVNVLNGLPTSVSAVTIENGHVSRLSIGLMDRTDSEPTVDTVINSIGPSAQHPLFLQWRDYYRPEPNSLRFSGSVDVHACDYGDPTVGDNAPEKYYTATAIALQKSLRERYDSCHR